MKTYWCVALIQIFLGPSIGITQSDFSEHYEFYTEKRVKRQDDRSQDYIFIKITLCVVRSL